MPLFLPTPKYKYLSLPDNWDDGWRAAKAASATTQARMAIVGDSDSSGYGVTNWWTKRWSSLLRTQLTTKYGNGGDFFPSTLSADYAPLPGTSPFIHNGATPMTPVGGGFGRAMYYTAASVNTAYNTFVCPYACTDFTIHYVDVLASGSFGYTIDGGANQTVTLPAVITNRQNKANVTGLASSAHTIVFNNSSASAALVLAGISTFATNAARTSGIGVVNCSLSGGAASDWLPTGGFPSDMPGQWLGTYGSWTVTAVTNVTNPQITISQTPTVPLVAGQWIRISGVVGATGVNGTPATNNGYWQILAVNSPTTFTITTAAPGVWSSGGVVYAETGFGWPSAPQLLIIEYGGNDMAQAIGLDSFFDAMRTICQNARRASQDCTILFILTALPTGESDCRLTAANGDAWVLYSSTMRDLSMLFNAGIYDLYAEAGQTGVARGWQTQADYHLTDAGHQHVSDVLSTVLV